MTPKHLCILLLALFASAAAQNDDIPVENDNQFPPDHVDSDGALIEGSGAGVLEEPLEVSTEGNAPIIEDVQLTNALIDNISSTIASDDRICPNPCVCHIDGETNKYIVDCSGYQLTELPKPLDVKTEELNLQNNNLTEIPKDISELKDLKVLNLNNNEIMQIVSGSVSELPELTSLKLSNNRLLEFPTDLKNSFGLTKLEELDLGENDMRETIKPEIFSNFKSLRKLTLPKSAAVLAEDLCQVLKQSLETVCTGTCSNKTFECQEAPLDSEDGLLDFVLPGLIAIGTGSDGDVDVDPVVPSVPEVKKEVALENEPAVSPVSTEITTESIVNDSSDASVRSAIMKATSEETNPSDVSPDDNETDKNETDVVGAATVNTKTGGVDKSVIGLVVAGMVVVIAGITIKKNWSSIRNRFSSSPRPANDRTGVNANGTTPEEVPLQEKSPV